MSANPGHETPAEPAMGAPEPRAAWRMRKVIDAEFRVVGEPQPVREAWLGRFMVALTDKPWKISALICGVIALSRLGRTH